ncbi:MAG: hypothetical protein PHG82_04090 [Candidatus Gracilibacteria bacterium]|nr:hypothetical protein [Candidatus Gracilibacteria bacterium]
MRGEKKKLPRDENGQIIIEHIDTKLTKKFVHTKISKVMLFINGKDIDFKFIEWEAETDFIVSVQQLKKLKQYYNYSQVINDISHIVFFIDNKKYVYQSGKRDISLGIFKQDNKISLNIINNNMENITNKEDKIILLQDDFGLLISNKENMKEAFGLCEGAILIEP